MAIHAYRTTLLSDDGSFGAEVISFPRYFEDHPAGLAQLERLGEELGAERGAPVTAETLPYMLEPIAYDTRGLGPRSALAVPQVIDEVFQEPIVIVEESPPFGTSLLTLLSQGATGYVWIIEGRPLLAVAGDLAFVVVWFALGPIKGVRRGLEEAAYEATKEVATEQLKRWLRRRFPSRRSK